MKNTICKYFIIIVIITAFCSCEQEVPIDINEIEPVLVVNSLFTDNKEFIVTVEKSCFMYDTNSTFLNNAVVKLYENEVFIKQLQLLDSGKYTASDFIPQVNKKYTVYVDCDGFNSVNASSKLPEKFTDTEYKIITDGYTNEYGEMFNLLKLKVNSNTSDNYYMLEMCYDSVYSQEFNFETQLMEFKYRNYPIVIYSDNIFLISENQILDNNSGRYQIIFSDKTFLNTNFEFELYFQNLWFDTDTIEIKTIVTAISFEMYSFLKKRDAIWSSQNSSMFGTEDFSQWYTNVENGFGIFAGYNCYVDSI